MVKTYFNIANLFNDSEVVDLNEWQLRLNSLKVGGVEQLTNDFFTEVVPTWVQPAFMDTWQYSNCSQLGSFPNPTSIDVCNLGGSPNSWNPFADAFQVNYSDTVNGFKRGEITTSISTSVYGLEPYGFGFDKVGVPINDAVGGTNGSSGASVAGAFWLWVDYTEDFYMEIDTYKRNLETGQLEEVKRHVYTLTVEDCGLNYEVQSPYVGKLRVIDNQTDVHGNIFASVQITVDGTDVENHGVAYTPPPTPTTFDIVNDLIDEINNNSTSFTAFQADTGSLEFYIISKIDLTTVDVVASPSYNIEFDSVSQSYSVVDAKSLGWLSGGIQGWVIPPCSETGDPIDDNFCDCIVTQSLGLLAIPPVQPVTLFENEKQCCFDSLVVGDLVDPIDYKNDINGFLLKRDFASETISFTLLKNGGTANGGSDIPLVDDTYGQFYDFGDFTTYPDYKAYQIQWRKVLDVEGEGHYQLKIDSNLITGPIVSYSIPFKLRAYTPECVEGTVRIQSIMDGYMRSTDINYKGLEWLDGLRFKGMFGNRQAEYEEERIIFNNRKAKQLRSELLNTYNLKSMHLPSCMTDLILDYHNLSNKMLITDYNPINHKVYIQKEVILDSVNDIAYPVVANTAPLDINYKDYLQHWKKSNC